MTSWTYIEGEAGTEYEVERFNLWTAIYIKTVFQLRWLDHSINISSMVKGLW